MESPELAECPVCLQPFDGDSTVPRVLACGHSVCEVCLIELPKPPFPRTIRCPACTQLVSYPHPQGPSALPKNIDLLRLSSSNPTHPNPKPKPKKPINSFQDFIPDLWSHEFYSNWKEWVVSQDLISLETTAALDGSCMYGRVINLKASSWPPTRCLLKENQKVSLFKVGSFMGNHDSRFKYSYVAKVMWILFKMTDGQLAELGLILRSSLKEDRICTAYGLWYNEEDKYLYLVFARYNASLSNVIVSQTEDDISSVAMIGMELCEAVSGLREAELVTGYLAPSCFCTNDFGHVFIDLNEVLTVGSRIRKIIAKAVTLARINDIKELKMNLSSDILESHAFVSPELLVQFLRKEGVDGEFGRATFAVSYSSDIWSLACILHWFIVGKAFVEETCTCLSSFILASIDKHGSDGEGIYMTWLEKVSSLLDTRLGSEFVVMKELLHKCLLPNPEIRPLAVDLWKCMRGVIMKQSFDIMGSPKQNVTNGSTSHCLLLGELCQSLNKTNEVDYEFGTMGDHKVEETMVEGDVIKGLSKNSLKCIDLKGHLDFISGLTIGGGFLFSSSFDKTVNVWSLQNFTHVHTFKGHEHRVTAVVFVNREPPLCISGDNGGFVFVWDVRVPFEEKPIKRLDEEKDWRFSGIHALAVSGSRHLYTGSGDKSIKAWSMHDYTLLCTMTGHKSVVSALAVCGEVLYSGSWDGTVRLWCLSDHSPLAVLGEETPRNSTIVSILSLSVDSQTLVAAYENGCIKMWKNDVPSKPISAHSGSIFSVYIEGKWVFSGGWDKTVVVQKFGVQEISGMDATEIGTIAGDWVVTALLYWQGKLFVAYTDKTIKVYSWGG